MVERARDHAGPFPAVLDQGRRAGSTPTTVTGARDGSNACNALTPECGMRAPATGRIEVLGRARLARRDPQLGLSPYA